MKWFKHETDALHSEKLSRLISEFGFEGYGRFWRIMEIVAERMDGSDRCHVKLPEREWLRLLSIRRPLFRRYLTVIQSIFDDWKITTDKQTQLIRIEIPNLLKKRDNYNTNLQAANKKLTNRSRSRKEVDVEVEDTIQSPKEGDTLPSPSYADRTKEDQNSSNNKIKETQPSLKNKLPSKVNQTVDTYKKSDTTIALETWIAEFKRVHGNEPIYNRTRDCTILKKLINHTDLQTVLNKIPHHIALNNYQSIPGFEACFNSLGLEVPRKKGGTRSTLDKVKEINQKLIAKEKEDERRKFQQGDSNNDSSRIAERLGT